LDNLSIQRDWGSTIARIGLVVGTGWVFGLCFVLLLLAAPKMLYRFREPNSSTFCGGIRIGTPLQDVLSSVDRYEPPLHEEVYRHTLDVAWHKGRCDVELDPANDRVIKVNLSDADSVKWDPPVK
jgi:hypothetical protein